MQAVAGDKRPKFCGDCGAALGAGERFCGNCGSAVVASTGAPVGASTPLSSASPHPAKPFLAALLLGGFWTMSNRLAARGFSVWLSLALTVIWLLSWVPLVLWWAAFAFGHREHADIGNLETITMAWVGMPLAGLLLNLPLARRSSALLVDPEPERQRLQARKGLALYAVVLGVGALTWAMDERISYAIGVAQADKLGR